RFFPSNAYLDEVAYCFAAWDLTPDALPADDDEFIERRVVPLADAVRMAVEGEITESVSKVTLLQYLAGRNHRGDVERRNRDPRRGHPRLDSPRRGQRAQGDVGVHGLVALRPRRPARGPPRDNALGRPRSSPVVERSHQGRA